MGKSVHASLNLFYGFSCRFTPAVQIMSQLGLADTGNAFQSGKAECFAVFVQKTGYIIVEVI